MIKFTKQGLLNTIGDPAPTLGFQISCVFFQWAANHLLAANFQHHYAVAFGSLQIVCVLKLDIEAKAIAKISTKNLKKSKFENLIGKVLELYFHDNLKLK